MAAMATRVETFHQNPSKNSFAFNLQVRGTKDYMFKNRDYGDNNVKLAENYKEMARKKKK